jgi:hypothetical protein
VLRLGDETKNCGVDSFNFSRHHNRLFGIRKIAGGTGIWLQKPPQRFKNGGLSDVILSDQWRKVVERKQDRLTGSEVLNLNVADSVHRLLAIYEY